MKSLLIAFAAILLGSSLAPIDAGHPNIVVILVDDMGFGDPACFNPDSKLRTPAIDSLARDGMRFTDAHAPGPVCVLSRYGLITGQYPFRAKSLRWSRQALVEPDQTTVASMLKAQGYRTAMVGKWHLGFNENGFENPLPGGPIDVGFDSFLGIRASTDIPPYFYIRGDRAVVPPTLPIEASQSEGWSPIQGAFWRRGLIAPNLQLKDVLPRFTAEAIGVIEGHAKEDSNDPLFLYLAYPAPHTPWLPSAAFAGKSKAGMYGDFVEMVDSMIGRVLEALDNANMREDTLLVFSSDNGPVWYDTDVARFGHDSQGVLRGMKADGWEAGHRMPFIVRWPGTVAEGSVSDQLLCFTDLLATFADITNYERMPTDGPDSISFADVLRGTANAESATARRKLAIRSSRGLRTYRDGDWKLMVGLGSGGFSKPRTLEPEPGQPIGQLYNLADDLGETTNLYDEHPEIVERMLAELQSLEGES